MSSPSPRSNQTTTIESRFNLAEAATHVAILAGEDDPVMDWRFIAESKDAKAKGKPPRTLRGRLSEVANVLKNLNAAGYAVYVLPNETDGVGAKKENIIAARCLVLDLDGAPLPETWEVEPSLILETSPGRFQCFWAIEPTHEFARCEDISKRLAAHFKGDPSAVDTTHVFRLAGFLHQKGEPFTTSLRLWDDPAKIRIGTFDRFPLEHFDFLPNRPKRPEHKSAPAVAFLDAGGAALLFEHLKATDFGEGKGTWLPLAMSLHDASGGDPEVCDLFLAWCLRDPEYNEHEEINRTRWESFRTDKGTRITAGTLYKICRDHDVPDDVLHKVFRGNAEADFEGEPVDARDDDMTFEGVEPFQYDMTRLPEMLDHSESAMLAAGAALYQTGGRVVHPVRVDKDSSDEEQIRRQDGSLIVRDLSALRLREYMVEHVPLCKIVNGEPVKVAAPMQLANHYLARDDKWNLPVLNGVIEAPTLRRDGSLLIADGYDEASGLLLDTNGVAYPAIKEAPTREDALAALATLKEPFREFPFVDDPSRSVMLSAVLTALTRRTLHSAPLHGTSAPTMGTGKTLLQDVVSLIATGRLITAMSQGANTEEDEKRLFSVLLQGDLLLLIDNVTRPIEDDALCTILTQATWQCRILGESRKVTVPTNALILASGNNLTFKGDMTTRALVCRIDAGVEKPEKRRFTVDLKREVPRRRAEFVAAGLTVLRAFVVAGRPGLKALTPFGRFEEWSNLVRGALVWLGEADPCNTRAYIDRGDPEGNSLGALLRAMLSATEEWETPGQLIKRATGSVEDTALMDAICDVVPRCNAQGLGYYLRAKEGRIIDGLRLRGQYSKHHKAWTYRVIQG